MSNIEEFQYFLVKTNKLTNFQRKIIKKIILTIKDCEYVTYNAKYGVLIKLYQPVSVSNITKLFSGECVVTGFNQEYYWIDSLGDYRIDELIQMVNSGVKYEVLLEINPELVIILGSALQHLASINRFD